MNIPSTGSFLLDMGLAFLIFLAGVTLAIKKGSKLGWGVCAVALFWAYKITEKFL
jgi:hypothetical protein